jgi:hypothetical protein
VSVKFTPEICINKAFSNSWLTVAGRLAAASDRYVQSCLQTLFFPLFLSSFDDTTNKLHLYTEKLTETVLHLNLGHFVVFWFFLVFLLFDETMTELLLRLHLQDWRLRD